MTRLTFSAVTAILLDACQPVAMPVPVEGSVNQLVGEWSGEFSSAETGRRGSIFFRLEAGQDTATGEVLLLPDRTYNLPTDPEWKECPWKTSARVLQISFVRCSAGEVDGWIRPYPDPDSGELTYTDFTGVIAGDSLRGTFASRLEKTGTRWHGTWAVVRTGPAKSMSLPGSCADRN